MDYHSLPRKQLQALCKKHDIPANQTNVQMADALTTLLKAEGKPKSDANAGRMQSARVDSGKENSNVPKASTRSNKEAVKSVEGGCAEHVASVEDVESNEGAKAGKTRGRGLPKLVPESKEHKDEIDGTTRKHCRGSQRERTCKNSDSDISTVNVTSKKMDKEKTSASEYEAVGEKARENIEGHQSLKAEETLKDQENHGKHSRHPRKKTMPEEQTKPKVVDVGTKRTRTGKATHHSDVATELSVKDVDGEKENATNKLPVIIDIVDSDDEEVVNGVNDKADIVDVSVESTVNPSESLKPVVTVNGSKSPKRVVTRKGHKGGHKKDEVLKSSSEEVKVNAVCISFEPASNSSECLKEAVTLRGKKEEKEVTASFDEGKVDTVHVSDEPAVKQRGQRGGKKEKLIVTNHVEEAKNIVADVPVEAIVNDSGSPKRVITRKGCNAEHKKEVLQTSSEEDKVDAVCVSAEPTSSSLKCLRQIVTRRGQKISLKEEMPTNASSEEDKIDVVNVSDEPSLNQRGRKGGKKGELIVTNSVEEAENIVTDVPVEATVNASLSSKGVVTRKGRKVEQKKDVLKTGSEEDKFNAVCVSVERTSTSLEYPKQVVTRRGQKCSHKEEKLMDASSEEEKIDVVNVPDEPAVNQRGRKGGKKGDLIVTNSIEEAKNIVTDIPVEATVNASESPKGVVTRKGRKGEHKEDLKIGSEEDKFNAVCVSVEPTSTSLQCLKQVVTRRGQKNSHKEEKVVNASSEEDKVDVLDEPTVNRRGRHGGQKKESFVSNSSQEVVTRKGCKDEHKKGEVLKANSEENKVNAVCVSVEPTLNSSESLKQVVTQRGVKCGKLLVNDSIKESKNNITVISVEDNVSASESPKRLVTRQGCKVVHEKVLDATAEESKANPVSIPVKPTVNCSENPKRVVTRRGRISKQEGRKVVTVISPECLKQVVAPGGEKCRQKLLVTDSLEEVKNNATDISVDGNVNASESPKRVVTQQESKVGNEKVVNASAKDSNVDLFNLNEKCSKTPKHVTRRGRINRQEEVLGTNCVEEAKNNTTGIPVEASLNFEDDASTEVTENKSLEHVTHEGQKNWFKEDLVNARSEENKVDASGMSDESIQDQWESSSEEDESDGKEKNADLRNLNDKNYGSKMKTRRTQQRQKPGNKLQQNEGNIIEDNNSDEKQKQTSSDTDGVMQKSIIRGRKVTYGKPEIRKTSQHEDLVQTEDLIDGDGEPHSSTLGSHCLHEAEAGEIVPEIVDRNKQSSSACEVDIESSVNEDDAHELRDSSSCEEEDLNDVKGKQLCPIQDVEISEQKASHGDSASDQEGGDIDVDNLNESLESTEERSNQPNGDSAHEQEDGGFEKKLAKVDASSDLAAKDDEALEEQTMAGSTVFIHNNSLDQSLESLEKDLNLPCEAGLESAIYEEVPCELRNSSSREENNFNDVKERKICLIQDLEISQQKAAYGDSFNDQEDGDFEKKLGKEVDASSDLAAKADEALEGQTVAGSTVFIDNILDQSLESLEKDSNLPCEDGLESAINEEDPRELRDSCSCEEGNFNDVKEKEICQIQDLEISQQRAAYGDSFNDQEDGDSEKKSEKVYGSLDSAAKGDDALEEQTVAGDGMISGSTVFVDNILDKSVESLEKDSNLPCEVDIDSAVNEEGAHELKDSSSCEEEDLNDVKEKELCLIQVVEISQQKASHGDSTSDQEDGDFNVDNLNEALEFIEEKTNHPHGDSANDQEDVDFEKKPDNVYTCSDLAAKDDKALEEQTMAGSIAFIDNMLDESLESAEKGSNLPREACLDSVVNEEDAHGSRDSSSCEEDNFNEQEVADFEEKSEKVCTSLDLAEKDDDALEEQTIAGEGMVAGSTVYVDNILDRTVESPEKDSNLPCEVDIYSAVNEEDAHELRDSCICEEEDLNDVKEKELEILEQKASHGDSAGDQEDEDFEKKSEKAYNSSSLTAKDDDTMEEQTMVGDAMIAGSTVFVDNILDNSNLPCEVGIVSAVNDEITHELRDSSSCEEGNFNYAQEKELYLIQDLEMSQQKISNDDSASVQENGDFEKKSEIFYTSSDLAAKDDEALEEKTMAGKGIIAGSTVFVDNMLAKSVEFQDKISNLQCEAGMDVAVNEEDVHESRDSSSSEEDNFNDVKEKELNLIGGLDITYDEDEDSGECHGGEAPVGNDGPQNLLSYVIEEASLSGTPLKKLKHAGSSNISYFSGINDSAVEERQETLPTDCQSDASMEISGLIERHNELCTSRKKTEFTSSTTVSPWLGMDDFVTEESVELPELDNLQEMPEFTKGQLSPHLNSLFEEDTLLKKSELTCSTNIPPCSGMDDTASEWNQEDCMKEDCNLGVPETDSPSTTLVLEKGHKESLFSDTLFGEGSPVKCELIHSTAVPHSGVDDSAIKQSEVRPSTEAGKIELSEFDAPSKIFDCTEDNDFSFSPCLNIFGTPLKNPVLQSITGMPISSGVDDSAIKQSEVSPSTEAGKIELSEFDAPSKIFDCAEDNDFSLSPCLNIFDTPMKNPVPQSVTGMPISSGMDDFAVEHNQGSHSTEACMKEDCNLGVPEIDSPSKMLVLENGHEECLFLDRLFAEGTPLKKCELISTNTVPRSSMDDSAIEQSEVNPWTGTCKMELFEFNAPSDVTKDDDFSFSPCLNIFDTPPKDPVLQSITGIPICSGGGDSDVEQSSKILTKETSKLNNHDLQASSEMPEHIDDQDNSPCLNTLSVKDIGSSLKNCEVKRSSDISSCSGVVNSVTHKVQEILPTEASKNEFSQIDDFSVERSGDRSPFLNTLFVDKIDSTLKNFEHTSSAGVSPCGIDDSDVLPAEACKLGISELNTPSEIFELSTDDDTFSCLKDLSVVITDTSLKTPMFTRGIDDSARDLSGDVLSKMAENTEDHDRSPCLETLFVDDKPLLSGMDNSTADQSVDGLPTEACKQELSQLDASSEKFEVTKDQDRSPVSNTVFLEGIGNLSKNIELTNSTRVKCSSVMNDSVLEQNQVVLPLEFCKQECNKFDTPLKLSELTKDHSLSPCLNMDSTTVLEMSKATNDTDISVCPGGTDSGLPEMLEIHGTEDSKLQTALVRQSSSTSSERPKLEDIDDLLQCVDIDNYAPEEDSEILSIEASKLQCCQLDYHLKMVEPTEGHDNPGLQSSLAVESDLTKVSLRQLRRLYKKKQMKQKKSGKVRRKHLALQDLSSNVLGEESSLFRKPEESQQDCKTDLQCNNVSEVNTTSNEPELAEASEKLDKPEEFHQKSPAEIGLPQMTSSYRASSRDNDFLCVSPAAGTIISEDVFGESQQDKPEDCNKDVSQVNITSKEPELAEGSEKLEKPEEFSTGSDYVLHQTSPAEIRLPEMTSSYRVSPGSGIDDSILACKTDLCFNNQPSEVYSPLSKPELVEACNKPDKLDENSTSLKKSKDTGDHDLLCESPASRIITSETLFADEKPLLPNNSMESGLFFEEPTVCKTESRIPRLVDRLKILNDRLQTMQSNLQGLAPELSYATPLRKGMNCRSIGSAKKNRVPMSVGRSSLASAKENPTDKTPLSLKRGQRSYKENQIKSKDSEKVVGKRPALKNLSLNVLEEREKKTLHIHEED